MFLQRGQLGLLQEAAPIRELGIKGNAYLFCV